MTEREFLDRLAGSLRALPQSARDDIRRDYEEHFASARESGKSEAEVAERLGDPVAIGRAHLAEERISAAENAPTAMKRTSALVGVVKALLILAPLNFIVILGPLVILVALLFAGWVTAGAFAFAGAVGIVEWVRAQGHGMAPSANASLFFLMLSLLGFSGVGLMLMGAFSSACTKLVLNYFRWNIRFITEKGSV